MGEHVDAATAGHHPTASGPDGTLRVRRPARSWRLATVATAALVLAACGDGGADGGGQSISLTIGAGHEAGGTVTYATWMQEHLIPELERRVEEETDHTLSVTEAFGGSIAGTDEVLDAVETGLLDIGGICYCFEPSALFLHNIDFFVPFSSPDPEVSLPAMREVVDEVPYLTEVLEESHNQRLIGLYSTSSYELQTGFPVESVQDLDGRSLSAAGPNLPWIPDDVVNVTTVQGGLPDWYTGMQTGVYEGVIIYPEGAAGYRLHEVAEHTTFVGLGSSPHGGVHINLDTFQGLPEEVQAIVEEVGRDYEETMPERIVQDREDALEMMEGAGTTVSELSEQARAEWADALPEIPQAQLAEAESRGLDAARDVFEAYIRAQEERGYEFPRDWEL